MSLKSIAVFIEPAPSGEARIACAARLAQRHGAHDRHLHGAGYLSAAPPNHS